MVERNRERRWGLRFFIGLLVMAGLVWVPSFAGATTSLGEDIEVQAWYRMRQTFQTDGDEHFDWAAWRNEAFVWLTYDNMVEDGKLKPLGELFIPGVTNAAISARFRARVDPVYYLREHYRNLYDENHRSDFFAPEKEFRDVYIDMKHGQIGPGKLSTRWGYQQIVWGESDLFRSLDIINPLRIDQTFAVGEKFDEFRLPILAAKLLYDIGNIGQTLSDTAIEAWYSPRFRATGNVSHIILEEGWRIPFQERGCLGPNGKLLDYSPENCANSRKFLPFRPGWLSRRRAMNPWSVERVGPNSRVDPQDFFCITPTCAPDEPGSRASFVYNLAKGNMHHHSRGIDPGQWSAGGVRFLAKTGLGVDFSLNYIFLPLGPIAQTNPNSIANAKVFGDFPFLGRLDGTLEEGLRRCLSPSGKSNVGRNGQTNDSTWLTGVDLRGYDWPERHLDANGRPLPTAKQKQAARTPITLCSNPVHRYDWSHIIGVTGTYNDFDYTGAVFRLEESVSTKEGRNKLNPTKQPKIWFDTVVWRSMVGFDLISALENYRLLRWTHNMPGQYGTQQSFITFQWLMEYDPSMSNTFSEATNAPGIPGFVPAHRRKHWNHLFTLAWVGNGFFHGKLEQRVAYVLEPRAKQMLFYGQWWWRGFMDLPVDLSTGTAWYPSSRMDNSWTSLQLFNKRNLLWVEATYYVL